MSTANETEVPSTTTPEPAIPIITPQPPTLEEYRSLGRMVYKYQEANRSATAKISWLMSALQKANLKIGCQRSQLRALNNKWAVLVHAMKEARKS